MNTIKNMKKWIKWKTEHKTNQYSNFKGNEVKRKSLPTADFTNHRVSHSKNGVSQSFK